jgi:hypothetical protein
MRSINYLTPAPATPASDAASVGATAQEVELTMVGCVALNVFKSAYHRVGGRWSDRSILIQQRPGE